MTRRRSQRGLHGRWLVYTGLLLVQLATTCTLRAQGIAGAFVTVVVRDTTGAPLLHAIVEASDSSGTHRVRRLTDAAGVARLPQSQVHTARIDVRRLGFRRESVTWQAGTGVVQVRLRPLAHALARVDVRSAPSRCQAGYVPFDADSSLRQVIDGIDVYARQEAALDEQYPWTAEWSFSGTDHNGAGQVVNVHTTRRYVVDSRTDTLRYARGRMVERRGLSWVKTRYERARDLTLPEFLSHHCFALSDAPDTALGRPALHLRFRADRTVRSADTDGSVLLDPETLAPLKAIFRWVNLPPGFADGEEVVRFCEVLPGVVTPVQRRFWQRYSRPLYRRDERIEWSHGTRTLHAMRWQGDAMPSGLVPSLTSCGVESMPQPPGEGRSRAP